MKLTELLPLTMVDESTRTSKFGLPIKKSKLERHESPVFSPENSKIVGSFNGHVIHGSCFYGPHYDTYGIINNKELTAYVTLHNNPHIIDGLMFYEIDSCWVFTRKQGLLASIFKFLSVHVKMNFAISNAVTFSNINELEILQYCVHKMNQSQAFIVDKFRLEHQNNGGIGVPYGSTVYGSNIYFEGTVD